MTLASDTHPTGLSRAFPATALRRAARALFATESRGPAATSALVLRLVLGGVMFPHGAQKVLGWFGGGGFGPTLHAFTADMGLPAAVALLVFAAEFLGSIGLVLGALTRVAALGQVAVMAGAIATVHWQNGFFMNWFGAQAGEGFEYHLLVIGMGLALAIAGGGRMSVDAHLARRMS